MGHFFTLCAARATVSRTVTLAALKSPGRRVADVFRGISDSGSAPGCRRSSAAATAALPAVKCLVPWCLRLFLVAARGVANNRSGLSIGPTQGCLYTPLRAVYKPRSGLSKKPAQGCQKNPLRAVFNHPLKAVFKTRSGLFFAPPGVALIGLFHRVFASPLESLSERPV